MEMGLENMVPLSRKSVYVLAASIAVTLATAWAASALPLEKLLSEYPGAPTMPWHPSWRVALAMFYLWLTAAIIYSFGKRQANYLLLVAGLAFVVAHYAALRSLPSECKLTVSLMHYFVVCDNRPSPVYLDMGQLVLVVTVAVTVRLLARVHFKKAPSSSRR